MIKVNKKTIMLGFTLGVAAYTAYKVVKTYKKVREEIKHNEVVEAAQEVLDQAKIAEKATEMTEEEKYWADWEETQEENRVNGKPYLEIIDDIEHEFVEGPEGEKYETIESMHKTGQLSDEEYNDLMGINPEPYFEDNDGNTYESKEDLGTMRFEANSPEARKQYMNYLLADIEPGFDKMTSMQNLFDFKYIPTRDLDDVPTSEMAARRYEFFGEEGPVSQDDVTVAEVLMYYAEKIQWNYDFSLAHILTHLVNNLQQAGNSLEDSVDRLNDNRLASGDIIGLFGLDNEYLGRYLNDNEFGLWAQMQNIDDEEWANQDIPTL